MYTISSIHCQPFLSYIFNTYLTMSLIGMLMSRPSSVGTSTTHPVSAFVRNKKNCVKTTYWSNNGQWHSPNELLSSLDKFFLQLGTFCNGMVSWEYNWLVDPIYMGYWPSVRSRWLDTGQAFFACLWTETESRSINPKKNKANIQPSRLNKLGQ